MTVMRGLTGFVFMMVAVVSIGSACDGGTCSPDSIEAVDDLNSTVAAALLAVDSDGLLTRIEDSALCRDGVAASNISFIVGGDSTLSRLVVRDLSERLFVDLDESMDIRPVEPYARSVEAEWDIADSDRDYNLSVSYFPTRKLCDVPGRGCAEYAPVLMLTLV